MSEQRITIDLAVQELLLHNGGEIVSRYGISSAANGPGELADSECTPRGLHVVDEKFGEGCAANTVFVGRRSTGEIYSPELRAEFPQRDWILTRILWLRGLEPGRNSGGSVDTKNRYIYLHGAPDETDMSVPGSHGCIRLRNQDIIELFAVVAIGTKVDITA